MGNSSAGRGRAPVHLVTSPKSWIEGAALRQLEDVATWSGVHAVVGLPDLHPGKYGPVGCAMLSSLLYPAFVGGDIGCGMALSRLDLPVRKVRIDTIAERLRVLAGEPALDVEASREADGLPSSPFDSALGTIGGGNHFCEVQAVDQIFLPDVASAAGLHRDMVHLLVHSGSRGLGHAVLEDSLARGIDSLDPVSDAGAEYLTVHNHAVRWATLNRRLIAQRAADALRTDMASILDSPHNMAEVQATGIVHRKGAAAANRGLVAIPGSRGTLTYLVEPLPTAPPQALSSLAHGAGRKYDRASMLGRAGRNRSEREALAHNPYGGRIICEDRTLLIEEAPGAYKNIAQVIADLVTHGLVRVVATLKPLVTFKRALDPALAEVDAARIAEDLARADRRRAKEAGR